MSRSEALANVLTSVVSLLGLLALLVGPYQRYRTDVFRQRLFALRDRLFDLAANGHMAFDAPAYVQLRTTINGYIRFGERFGMTELLLAQRFVPNAVFAASSVPPAGPTWAENTRGLRPDVRHTIDGIRTEVHVALLRRVALSPSPLFVVAALLYLPFFVGRHTLHAGWRIARRPILAARRSYRDALDSADNTAFIAGMGRAV